MIKSIGVGLLAFLFCGRIGAQDVPSAPAPITAPSGDAQPSPVQLEAGERLPRANPANPGQATPVSLPGVRLDELSALLKEKLLDSLPAELVFESNNNWGHQSKVPSVQGVKLTHAMRNQGDWEKATVIAKDVPRRLSLRLNDLYFAEENRIAFTMRLTIPAKVELRKQIWLDGVEVYTSHVRARFQLSADLTMEAVMEPAGKERSSADGVASFQLSRATCSCNRFVAENINGLGGDFARLFDGSVKHSFKPWQPSALREFQNRVADAVQIAGDTGEVRAGLNKVLLESTAARTAFLQAQTAASSRQALPAVSVPAGAAECPVEAAPPPLVLEWFLDFPLWVHIGRSFSLEPAIHAEHPFHDEHPGYPSLEPSPHGEHLFHHEYLEHSSATATHVEYPLHFEYLKPSSAEPVTHAAYPSHHQHLGPSVSEPATHTVYPSHYEHLGLSDHSIHTEYSRHSGNAGHSSSGIHADPVRKK